MKHVFSGNMQFTDCLVQARTVYSTQLRFGPLTILTWTAQSLNCHIALKVIFYLLNIIPMNRHNLLVVFVKTTQ